MQLVNTFIREALVHVSEKLFLKKTKNYFLITQEFLQERHNNRFVSESDYMVDESKFPNQTPGISRQSL